MRGRRILCLFRYTVFATVLSLISHSLKAQGLHDFFNDSVNIRECISYTLRHQPLVSQLKIDEEIADQTIKSSLADWFPQIISNAGYQRYLKQPVIIFPSFSNPSGPKIEVTTGVKNSSNLQFSATQKIFDSDLLFAGRSARYYRREVRESGQKEAIQLVVDVSKAFYDVLLTRQIQNIVNDDIDRLTKGLNDALAMFNNGVKDKIDYSRATLSLNSARSQKISVTNSINAKLTYLKQLMGYPDDKPLLIRSSIGEMKTDLKVDTLMEINYSDRIEYKLLQTSLMLQKLTVGYFRENFLPSLSGNANYNFIYQNDEFSRLYNKTFPNSTVGLTFSWPLFEGGKRIHDLKKSKLRYDRLVLDTINLKNEINTGYVVALTTYKNNLAAYNLTKQNIEIARDVYNTVFSQYREGVKPYLEVIISETDLRTAQLNNLSSLIMLMFSKIDVDQALGRISVDY